MVQKLLLIVNILIYLNVVQAATTIEIPKSLISIDENYINDEGKHYLIQLEASEFFFKCLRVCGHNFIHKRNITFVWINNKTNFKWHTRSTTNRCIWFTTIRSI